MSESVVRLHITLTESFCVAGGKNLMPPLLLVLIVTSRVHWLLLTSDDVHCLSFNDPDENVRAANSE